MVSRMTGRRLRNTGREAGLLHDCAPPQGSPGRQAGPAKAQQLRPHRPMPTFWSGCALCTTALCASITKRVISYVITPSTRLWEQGWQNMAWFGFSIASQKAGHLVRHHAVHQAAECGWQQARGSTGGQRASAVEGFCTSSRRPPGCRLRVGRREQGRIQLGCTAESDLRVLSGWPHCGQAGCGPARNKHPLPLTCSRRPRRSWPARAPPRCSCGLRRGGRRQTRNGYSCVMSTVCMLVTALLATQGNQHCHKAWGKLAAAHSVCCLTASCSELRHQLRLSCANAAS